VGDFRAILENTLVLTNKRNGGGGRKEETFDILVEKLQSKEKQSTKKRWNFSTLSQTKLQNGGEEVTYACHQTQLGWT
jgi:hypothetical protein